MSAVDGLVLRIRSARMELWELIARERIRDTLCRYNWAGDALRLSELAEAFCEDGELEIRGRKPVQGRGAIVDLLGGVVASVAREDASAPAKPQARIQRIVRHLITNVEFLEVAPDQALVASYFTVLTELGLDHYGRYRDTLVPVGDAWLLRHRFVSTDWRSVNSTMAPPSSKSSRGPE